MTQVKLFSVKKRNDCEYEINEFLKTLGDIEVQIQYVPTLTYFEACIIYNTKRVSPYKRKRHDNNPK